MRTIVAGLLIFSASLPCFASGPVETIPALPALTCEQLLLSSISQDGLARMHPSLLDAFQSTSDPLRVAAASLTAHFDTRSPEEKTFIDVISSLGLNAKVVSTAQAGTNKVVHYTLTAPLSKIASTLLLPQIVYLSREVPIEEKADSRLQQKLKTPNASATIELVTYPGLPKREHSELFGSYLKLYTELMGVRVEGISEDRVHGTKLTVSGPVEKLLPLINQVSFKSATEITQIPRLSNLAISRMGQELQKVFQIGQLQKTTLVIFQVSGAQSDVIAEHLKALGVNVTDNKINGSIAFIAATNLTQDNFMKIIEMDGIVGANCDARQS